MEQYSARRKNVQKPWYEEIIDMVVAFGGLFLEIALFLISLGKTLIKVELILRKSLTQQEDWREQYR